MLDKTPPDVVEETPAPAAPASSRRATAIYAAITAQLRARIERLGLPMWKCDDLSGLQDGYTAKLLHPDTPSGRQARWETMQLLVDALFPDGYEIIIRPLDAKKALKLEVPSNPVVDARVRSVMRAMGRKGGLKSSEVRRAKLIDEQQKRAEDGPHRLRRLAKRLGRSARSEQT